MKFALTQDLNSLKLFNYTIMMWKRETYINNFHKNKYAFFCGKFDTFDLDKYSSMIVKNSEDLNLISYIMKKRKILKFNNEILYDQLISKL